MDENARPGPAGGPVSGTAESVRRHERLAALHEALAARGSGDVTEHARKAKAHREEAERLRGDDEAGDPP